MSGCRRVGGAIFAALLVPLSGGAAVAQNGASDDIIRGYLDGLAALGDLEITYGAVTTDAATGETTVADLDVVWSYTLTMPGGSSGGGDTDPDRIPADADETPADGAGTSADADGTPADDVTPAGGEETLTWRLSASVEETVFANLSLEAGVYRADRITASPARGSGVVNDGGQNGEISFEGGASELTSVAWTSPPTITVDPDRPASSYAPLVDWLLTQSFESALVGPSVIAMDMPDGKQVTRQGAITMGRLQDGMLASYATAEAVTEMTASDTSGATEMTLDMTMTVLPSTTRGLSYKPIVTFLTGKDAEAAAGYQSVVEHSSVAGMRIEADEFNVTFGEAVTEGIKMKAPGTPFLQTLDRLLTSDFDDGDPAEILRLVFDVYGAFSIDRMALGDIAFTVPGQAEGRLAEIGIRDFSDAGLGRFGFSGLEVSAPDTEVRLGAFTLADLKFPSLEALLKLEDMDDENPDFQAIYAAIPQLGLVSLEDIHVETPLADAPVRLGRLLLEQSGFLPVPTNNKIELSGLSVPLAYAPAEGRAQIEALGVDPVEVDVRFDVSWDEDTSVLALGPIEIAMPKIGALAINGALGGVPRSVFEDPATAQEALATLSVAGLEIVYRDMGLAGFAMRQLSEQLGTPVEELPEAMSDQVEAGLGEAMPDNPELARETAQTVKAFLDDPKSLTISIKPAAAVPVAQIIGAAAFGPGSIPGLLNLTIEANTAE